MIWKTKLGFHCLPDSSELPKNNELLQGQVHTGWHSCHMSAIFHILIIAVLSLNIYALSCWNQEGSVLVWIMWIKRRKKHITLRFEGDIISCLKHWSFWSVVPAARTLASAAPNSFMMGVYIWSPAARRHRHDNTAAPHQGFKHSTC